jgi:poly-gamma-glutamate capsule biosynthesis protein CapA/YwtB (metallophosphatase superfamily)
MLFNYKHRLLPLIFCATMPLILACTQQQIPVTPTRQVKPASPPAAKIEIVIGAVGDIMMPESIQSVVVKDRRGYDLLFERIAPDLSAADITFANLETSVDHKAGVSGYPKFNARPELLASLKKAGVNIVSVANNHAMDMGSDGLKRTLDNIEATGLAFIGAGRTKAEAAETKFLKIRGVKVAFLAYTYGTNQRMPRRSPDTPGVNILGINSETDLSRAAACVRQARADADLVVVSLHWGYEYATSPTSWQRRVASELIESGADILLGHHPHVLQPIESYVARDKRRGLIVYSLGNFISSQNADVSYANKTHEKALRGDGIILSITATKEGDRTQVAHAEFLPIWSLREPIGKAIVYRPVSLARELSVLGAKQKRDSTEEKLMRLLSYRLEFIIRTLTGAPE